MKKFTAQLAAETQVLLLINGISWLILALVSIVQGLQSANLNARIAYALLMFGVAGIIAIIGMLLEEGRPHIYYVSLIFLAFISFLTIADQVGFWDVYILIINSAAFVSLLAAKEKYTNPPKKKKRTIKRSKNK